MTKIGGLLCFPPQPSSPTPRMQCQMSGQRLPTVRGRRVSQARPDGAAVIEEALLPPSHSPSGFPPTPQWGSTSHARGDSPRWMPAGVNNRGTTTTKTPHDRARASPRSCSGLRGCAQGFPRSLRLCSRVPTVFGFPRLAVARNVESRGQDIRLACFSAPKSKASKLGKRLGRSPPKNCKNDLTIKLDGNWSSFQLAISAPPLSVTGSAIAPSARIRLALFYFLDVKK